MNESHEAHTACWVTIEVNGVEHKKSVQPRVHLVDFLRENLDMRTVRAGCEHGVCGSCTVRLDGDIVRGCLVLAVQADGGTVETIDAVEDQVRELGLAGAGAGRGRRLSGRDRGWDVGREADRLDARDRHHLPPIPIAVE